MKRLLSTLFILAAIAYFASAQDNNNRFSIGISGGINSNMNAYRFEANTYGNEFINGDKLFNIGLDFGIMATQKLRPRIEFKYVKMNYSADWVNTGFTTNKESVVTLFNINTTLHLDYLMLNKGKLQFFISPGVKWEFNYDREVKNIKTDGTYNYNNYNNIINECPENILGGTVTAIVKYNIYKGIGITLAPEYTMFFTKFDTGNDKPYQRVSANIGVEFKF